MSAKWQLVTILTASIAVHFIFFGRPNETVFDEVHFGKFVSGYYTGEYYFDIHPPLGKLMIAGFAKVVDFSAEGGPASGGQYNFTDIGKEFPDKKYLALRFLPVLAGTLLPLVIYLLILELGMSRMAAFAGALLTVFDNALLTQSRFILLDPFLLLFGFTSLLFYFRHRHHPQKQHEHYSHILENMRIVWDWDLFWMAVFAGLAISIKWTGLSFIALPIIIETYDNFTKHRNDAPTTDTSRRTNLAYAKFVRRMAMFCSFFVISLIIYFSVFSLHFALLPKSGPGDAFMKPNFREQNVIKNIVDLNIEMYKSNQRLGATHPYSSQWHTWPLMSRPIYYWVDSNPSPQVKDSPSTSSGQATRVYFFGNPIIWWSSTAAVIILLLRNLQFFPIAKPSRILDKVGTIFPALAGPRQGGGNFQLKTEYILLGGYFLNLLPFIGVKRVMFLYHYLIPLIFAILMLVYLIDRHKNSRKIFTGIVIASVAAFLFFAPLTYGLPLSDKAYSARIWFASWK